MQRQAIGFAEPRDLAPRRMRGGYRYIITADGGAVQQPRTSIKYE